MSFSPGKTPSRRDLKPDANRFIVDYKEAKQCQKSVRGKSVGTPLIPPG